MSESYPLPETVRITDEQATEALRRKEIDPISQALFEQWLDQSQAGIDRIYESEGNEATAIANIKWEIKRATIYYRAGFSSEAMVVLEEVCDATGSKIFDVLGIHEEVLELLRHMKTGEPV